MDTAILYKQGKKHQFAPFSIGLLLILFSVFLLYADYIKRLSTIFDTESELYVREISRQTEMLIEDRLKNRLMNLEQLATVFRYSENLHSDVVFDYLAKQAVRSGVIRFGVALPDGTYRTSYGQTAHRAVSITDRDYFRKSMNGLNAVEFSLHSLVGGQEIFVCSVPIMQERGIGGVLTGIYDVAAIENALTLQGFSKDSFSVIIDADGDFITGRGDTNLAFFDGNFFRNVSRRNFQSREAFADFKTAFSQRTEYISSMRFSENPYFVYIHPLSFDNCSLLMMFPAKLLTLASSRFTVLTVFLCVFQILFLVMIIAIFGLMYKKNKRDLYVLAFEDSITKGGNNSWFSIEASSLLSSSQDTQYAFVIIDIDHLKILNDTFGYENGNRVLKYVYDCLNGMLVSDEIAVRAMQDDFIMLLKFHSKEVLQDRLKLMAARIGNFNVEDDRRYVISISAGIYQVEDPRLDILTMQDRAFIALENAKRQRGSLLRCAYFREQDRKRLREEKRIENRMEEALASGEFIVYLQPKYDIGSDSVTGAEALIRWLDPERGMIRPDEFIPLFERNGFIFSIDLFVFEQVCKLLRSELDRGLTPHTISVNLSLAYLNRPNFLRFFKDICLKYDIPPTYLELELTETIVFENMELLIRIIREMHEFGFTCSLDDFGSGYSSLNMLKAVPVDVLKLDKEFFADNGNDDLRGTSVIESVIELARKLKMKTVSEGVEKKWQVDFLRQVKCDMVQGFVYSQPVCIREYEQLAFGSPAEP